jgi:outer membrane protein OmpA-like peptidoglycan-associated protein
MGFLVRERQLAAKFLLAAGAVVGTQAAQPATVPLCPGLQITTAINQANGDYESIKTIESATDLGVRLKYTSERLITDVMDSHFGEVKQLKLYRSILRKDLANAPLYEQMYFEGMPETIPGSTAIGISSDSLKKLKAGQPVEISISNAYSGEYGVDENVRPNLYDFQTPGTITRVEASAVMMPVIVNDVKTALPAIHAKGDFAGEAAEFYILDDTANPLTLKFRIGINAVPPMIKEQVEECAEMAKAAPAMSKMLCTGKTVPSDRDVLEVVSISYRCAPTAVAAAAPQPAAALSGGETEVEHALATSGKVAVYDIHFGFNSAVIREESAPRLKEIAEVLKQHGDWRLSVNGHTDNISSDQYNLDLSKRRAEAVKAALVTQYGIDAARLATSGLGETQPVETNETLEGRARNRRVELIKQ